MTQVKWSPYSVPFTLLGNELSALGNNALSAAGIVIQSDGSLYFDVEFVAGAAFSPTDKGAIDVWMLRSLDGTSYEDGSSSVTPPRDADAIIPVRGGTSITPRAGYPRQRLPVGYYRGLARNRTGVPLPANSVIRIATYSEQAV